jgi:glycosyltransferase involved in cell wall biosynthesis
VLTVVDRLTAPGPDTIATRIAVGLDQDRFESVVCSVQRSSPRQVEAARAAGVEVLELRRRSRLAVWRWLPLLRLLRSGRVDVVHAHTFGSNVWLSLLTRLGRTRVFVAHEHSWSYEGALHRLADRLLVARKADAVVAVSPADRTRMIQLERIPAHKVVVIPDGIAGPDAGDAAQARRALGIPTRAQVVGTVCALRPEKELDTALRAMARLEPRRPRLRFLVVGDGPERPRLERLAAELGAPAVFLGHRTSADVPDLLAVMDVVVSSSRFESMPLSVLEWMAAGKAIVAGRVGGIPAILEDGREAILVPPRDHVAFADAIDRLLDNPAERRRLGQAAKKRQRTEFSLEVTLTRLESLYERLYRLALR